jgi:hypothetical protein
MMFDGGVAIQLSPFQLSTSFIADAGFSPIVSDPCVLSMTIPAVAVY